MKTIIKAEIVAHSVNEQGDELISVLATFPRIILAEVNTHRMLSKNTSSSRAIPFNKMVESVQNDTFIPIAWQKEHKGMQGTEYLNAFDSECAKEDWLTAMEYAVEVASNSNMIGVTKQLCNRLLEPFMWTTMLITGPKSGWDNFFKLRCPIYELGESQAEIGTFTQFKSKKDALKVYPKFKDEDTLFWLKTNKGQAEIHMMALAESVWDSYNESTPKVLKPGEWHIPFEDKIGEITCIPIARNSPDYKQVLQSTQVMVSVAMAARTSYTVVGEEKALDYEAMIGLHDRLLAWDPPHSSPLEHAARCMSEDERSSFSKTYWIDDLTEMNMRVEEGWCNNFKGFIPYRYMVDNGNQETKN